MTVRSQDAPYISLQPLFFPTMFLFEFCSSTVSFREFAAKYDKNTS